MAINIAKHVDLLGMLTIVVKAKRDGMMDHKEAKAVWGECLRAVGIEAKEVAGSQYGGGGRA